MARAGFIYILKDWLTTSKTYHGPINLRFTWPIELTKTYHTGTNRVWTHILNFLGNMEHGMCYTIGLQGSNITRRSVSVTNRGTFICRYMSQPRRVGIVESQILVIDADVMVPEIVHVRYFAASLFEPVSSVFARMVKNKDAYYSSNGRLEVSFRGVMQKVYLIKNKKYENVLAQLVKYS